MRKWSLPGKSRKYATEFLSRRSEPLALDRRRPTARNLHKQVAWLAGENMALRLNSLRHTVRAIW